MATFILLGKILLHLLKHTINKGDQTVDSSVLKTLSGGSDCKLDNEKDLRSSKPTTYTATISGTKNVYSIFPGTVLFLGYYKGTGTIYLCISNHELIRYMNLKDFNVWKGQDIEKGTLLGASSNVPLQFEYCTVYQQDSKYPVRFANRTYYKQNPIDILDGVYWPYKEITIKSGIVLPNNKYEFTEEQKREWYSQDYYAPDYGNETPYYFPTYNPQRN